MLVLFLKLLLAHIVGDFVLQTKKLVIKRRENVFYLLLHVCIHVILLGIVFFQNLSASWPYMIFIGFAHLAIDSMKIVCEKKWPSNPVLFFLADQFLHMLVILTVVGHIYEIPLERLTVFMSAKFLAYTVALLLTVVVSPILLRVFFSRWSKEHVLHGKKEETLLDAGLLIGVMERLIIVLFIQLGFLSGIGFLLAAKSIFRFGDLNNAKNTKFTEYVLVGTFASFLIAIIIGYALRLTLKYC
ncbi:DUF3307 domain-containing protein [Sphingobacterium sp. SGG-5]|uniref:DUF3307 domain-containing protein n=1 Tax=Sphingobacterium sp. SGG-5 TaxID=2710881 RepID=UPI0013E9AD6D|nr:DUF3307 domain-containing protein [Sphingobacterium sp. SGG-5]NGM61403.1 DUF3307 domain-containing protein [Sphingobacterium sp. SGG-5]